MCKHVQRINASASSFADEAKGISHNEFERSAVKGSSKS